MNIKKWSSNQTLEFWKTIEDYPNYMISSLGRVKSLNYRHTGKAKIMKLNKNKYGYLCVNLFKNGKGKRYCVHRLVTSAFISNPENKPCIDHINTVRTDNRVVNLRWCTQKENCNNSLTLKKMSEARKGEKVYWYGKHHSEKTKQKMSEVKKGEKNPRARKVRCIETGEIFTTVKEASEWCGMKGASNIIQQIQGKYKSAGKHPETGERLHWEYVEEREVELEFDFSLIANNSININIMM